MFGTQIMFGPKFMFDSVESTQIARTFQGYKWDINFVSNIKYFVPNKLLVPNILSHKSTGNTDSQ